MKLKSLVIAFLFLLSSFVSFAQDDAYKAFLKRTAATIHKAQKMMMVNHTTDVGGKLAKAVLLQSLAVKLYQEKKESKAACSSSLARQLAVTILKDLTGKEDVFSVSTDEEKKLMSGCNTETEFVKEAQSNFKTMAAATDKDYANPASLNRTNIDLK